MWHIRRNMNCKIHISNIKSLISTGLNLFKMKYPSYSPKFNTKISVPIWKIKIKKSTEKQLEKNRSWNITLSLLIVNTFGIGASEAHMASKSKAWEESRATDVACTSPSQGLWWSSCVSLGFSVMSEVGLMLTAYCRLISIEGGAEQCFVRW